MSRKGFIEYLKLKLTFKALYNREILGRFENEIMIG